MDRQNNNKRSRFSRVFRAVWIFLPLIAAAGIYFILPHFPWIAEYVFARGLFKIVTVPIGFVTSLIPISLTEMAVVLAVPLAVTLIVALIRRLKKSENRKKTALRAARGTAAFLSFACLMYMICHGANYYRYSCEQLLELDTSPKTADHLLAVCEELARCAAKEREQLSANENGETALPEDIFTELSRTNSGYAALTEDYPFLWTSVLRQKPVLLSEPWSYTLITGMYFPFFVECNVNTAQPEYSIPFTAAHESAHSRGIAFENECNFYAFLSCINSEYAEFRYAGYMEAYLYCSNSLYAYDKELWAQANALCTDEMRADFAANNRYIAEHQGKVQQAANSANDAFIKSQGVSDGTLSYGRMTELVLAYYAKEWGE